MMIEKMTKKAMLEVAQAEDLFENTERTFVDKAEASKDSNVIGVCKTKKGNFMVYMTNEKGKMTKTSVHANRREANGMVLRRLREASKPVTDGDLYAV